MVEEKPQDFYERLAEYNEQDNPTITVLNFNTREFETEIIDPLAWCTSTVWGSCSVMDWMKAGCPSTHHVKNLCFDFDFLTSLPKEIGLLTDVISIDCKNNFITSLPKEIGNMKSLRFISCQHNKLSSLPIELAQLPLEYIFCFDNCLKTIPIAIRAIKTLKLISDENNLFPTVEDEIKAQIKISRWWIPICYSLKNEHGEYRMALRSWNKIKEEL